MLLLLCPLLFFYIFSVKADEANGVLTQALFDHIIKDLPTGDPMEEEEELKKRTDLPFDPSFCLQEGNTDDALIQRVLVEGRKFAKIFKARDLRKKELLLRQVRAACNSGIFLEERINKIKEIFRDFNPSPMATGTLLSYNIDTFLSVCGSVYTYAKCNKLDDKKLASKLYKVVFSQKWKFGKKDIRKALIRDALQRAKKKINLEDQFYDSEEK